MKHTIFRYLAIILVLAIIGPISPAFATEVTGFGNVHDSLPSAAEIWIALRDSGELYVNEDGLFCVKDNIYSDCSSYKQFLITVEHCNISITEGIIVATNNNSIALSDATISNYVPVLEELCNSLGAFRSPIVKDGNDYSVCVAGGSVITPTLPGDSYDVHVCSEQYIEMIAICENNYQFLVSHFNSMLVLQTTDPTFNAWLSTASLWVSRVRPNGSWDYKVSAAYGPYNNVLCSYYKEAYRHITAEYFGNLNYGYTGSFLFRLDILHFGSSVVSGFDPADEADWPAIDEGYYLKTNS